MSEAIGKINYTTQSISINQDNTSTSFNTQRDYIVPPEDISQLSQGEFCGVVSDNFKQKIELKAFRGDVNPPKDDMSNVKYPMVYPNLTSEDLRDNVRLIQTQINELVAEEMLRIEDERQNAIEAEADNVRSSLEQDNILPFQNNGQEEEMIFNHNEVIENEEIGNYDFDHVEEKILFEEESDDDDDDQEYEKNRMKDFLSTIPNINDLKKKE
ncbi:hypothetical protein [Flavobacterium sp. CGRL2]